MDLTIIVGVVAILVLVMMLMHDLAMRVKHHLVQTAFKLVYPLCAIGMLACVGYLIVLAIKGSTP